MTCSHRGVYVITNNAETLCGDCVEYGQKTGAPKVQLLPTPMTPIQRVFKVFGFVVGCMLLTALGMVIGRLMVDAIAWSVR